MEGVWNEVRWNCSSKEPIGKKHQEKHPHRGQSPAGTDRRHPDANHRCQLELGAELNCVTSESRIYEEKKGI